MDNIVEIQNRVYVCPNCNHKNIVCPGCNMAIKDMNFDYWLILSRLEGAPEITIRFAQNASNKAMKIIELLKNSVGLIEQNKKVAKVKKLKIDLECPCSNKLTIFVDSEDKVKNYVCRRCMKKDFKINSKEETRVEIIDIILQKLPAVIALTERRR